MIKATAILVLSLACASAWAADRVLLFTRTAAGAPRESNIAENAADLRTLFEGKGLIVDASEDAAMMMTDASLAKYKAVVFLKTSRDILNSSQEAAFQKYIRSGGGFVGIHAVLATEYDWVWFGELISGAYYDFSLAPQGTKATYVVEDRTHGSTAHLPAKWDRTDEIYNLKANPRGKAKVLITVDEKTYSGGKMGGDHPMSWYGDFDGGRSWVTAMGHTSESYKDPLFLQHIWGGMQYALGAPSTGITIAAFPRAAAGVGVFFVHAGGFRAVMPIADLRGRRLAARIAPGASVLLIDEAPRMPSASR